MLDGCKSPAGGLLSYRAAIYFVRCDAVSVGYSLGRKKGTERRELANHGVVDLR